MKTITITRCDQCPNCDFDNQLENHKWGKYWCDKLDGELKNHGGEIPDHCPLSPPVALTPVAPVKAGWYWVRLHPTNTPMVVHVHIIHTGRLFFDGPGRILWLDELDQAMWSGPLDTP